MKMAGISFWSPVRLVALAALSLGLISFSCETAHANHGWGGSSGGFGSSGGSMGSCGGNTARWTPVRNLLGRIGGNISSRRTYRQSYGSSGGCCGGWVGCSGGYMTPGAYSGYRVRSYRNNVVTLNASPLSCFDPVICDPCMSAIPSGVVPNDSPTADGGSIESMLEGGKPAVDSEYYTPPVKPAAGEGVVPTPGPTGGTDGTTSTQRIQSGAAVLNLVLPMEAKVYINDQLTRTEGARRSYVSRDLSADRDYDYQVKVVLVRDKKELVRTQLVKMRSGLNKTVTFDFEESATTMLALNVPANAKVTLCGNATAATGELRHFSTALLKDGQVWKDYQVRVDYVVDGEKKTEERTFDMVAGETYQISMGEVGESVTDQIASR